MKRKWPVLLLVVGLFGVGCANSKSSTGKAAEKKIEKIIALLPVEVFSELRIVPEQKTVELLREEDRKEGLLMQRDMYRYFLRKMSELGYPQAFLQHVNETNKIIESHGITYVELRKIPKNKLADLLGVDGVVSATIDQFDAGPYKMTGIMNGKISSQRVRARFTYHDSQGHLIWKVDRKSGGTDEEQTYGISKKIMRKIPDKFPFARI